MRIWVLSTEYKPNIVGGLGVVATELAESMRDKGDDVSVISMCHRPQILRTMRGSVRITRFPHRLPYYSKSVKLYNPQAIMPWVVQHRRPDAIHVHSVQFTEVAYALRKYWRVPVVYTCHSLVLMDGRTPHTYVAAKSQERLLRFADRVVVPSLWLKQRLYALYPNCRGKVRIIPNGVRLGSSIWHGPKHHLLYVGRLVSVKGVEELISAMAILRTSHPHVRLDIAGTCSPQYTTRLKKLARMRHVDSRIRWLGFVPPTRLPRLYRSHGALIFPSRQETFGLVALEALANGLPLVCTQYTGLGEFVNRDVASIIQSRTPSGIAMAVREMWQSPHRTGMRVYRGRRLATRFRWSHVASQYHRLFRHLLSSRRR